MNNKGASMMIWIIITIVLAFLVLVLLLTPLGKQFISFNKFLKGVASPSDWCIDVSDKLNEARSGDLKSYEYTFELVMERDECREYAEIAAKNINLISSSAKDKRTVKWEEHYGTASTQDTARTGLLCCVYLGELSEQGDNGNPGTDETPDCEFDANFFITGKLPCACFNGNSYDLCYSPSKYCYSGETNPCKATPQVEPKPPSDPCTNNQKDGTETDIDCGGQCGPCYHVCIVTSNSKFKFYYAENRYLEFFYSGTSSMLVPSVSGDEPDEASEIKSVIKDDLANAGKRFIYYYCGPKGYRVTGGFK